MRRLFGGDVRERPSILSGYQRPLTAMLTTISLQQQLNRLTSSEKIDSSA